MSYTAEEWEKRSKTLRKARAKKTTQRGGYDKADRILYKAKALERLADSHSPSLRTKYEIVPPVNPGQDTYTRDYAEESWSEDDSADDDYIIPTRRSKHQQLMQPPMSFALVPVPYPAYHREPQRHRKHRHRKENVVNRSETERQKVVQGKPMAVSLPVSPKIPPIVAGQPNKYQLKDRFNKTPPPPQPSPPRRDRTKVLESSVSKQELLDAAPGYATEFINKQLEDELVLDVLIDVFNELSTQSKQPNEPLTLPAIKTNTKKPSEPVIVRHTTEASVSAIPSYLMRRQAFQPDLNSRTTKVTISLDEQAYLSKDITRDIIDEVIGTQISDVVRETTSEQVNDYIKESANREALNAITDELIIDVCNEAIDEILQATPSVPPPKYQPRTMNERHRQNDFQLLSDCAASAFLDGMMLDYLLAQLVMPERAATDTETEEFILEEMMLDVMLRELASIDISRSTALSIKPVKRLHERVITDVALDMLLNELCINLDHDMQDFDEYDTGLSNYLTSHGDMDKPPAGRR